MGMGGNLFFFRVPYPDFLDLGKLEAGNLKLLGITDWLSTPKNPNHPQKWIF